MHSNSMENNFTLHGKSFKAVENDSGISSPATIFTYKQQGRLITGEYQGGEIEFGNIVGEFIPPQTIKVLFQCKTKDKALLSGKSVGVIKKTSSGKLAISFQWQWVSGSEGAGNSYHEEV